MNIRRTCSRCLKRQPVAFQYELITINQLKTYDLCESCLKWTLLFILGDSDLGSRVREKLFCQVDDISSFLRRKKLEALNIKTKTNIPKDTNENK